MTTKPLDLDAIRRRVDESNPCCGMANDVLALLGELNDANKNVLAERDGWKESIEISRQLLAQRDRLAAENAKLREALEWYADSKRPWDHTIALAALDRKEDV